MVKNLSCVSCGSLKRFPHTFTNVTHANMKVFGLTPLFGDRRGFMPAQLKTKQNKNYHA